MSLFKDRAKKKAKLILEVFYVDYNAVSRKTIENMRKHGDIKFVTNKARKNYHISELNYHATKLFSENFSSHRNEKNHKYS